MDRKERKEAKPFPMLLTPADAMEYAAERLDSLCTDLRLMKIFKDFLVPRKDELPPQQRGKFQEIETMLQGVVDADLQEDAMRTAAKLIRSQAALLKLEAARNQQRNSE